jgi:cyclopentanol dehydrogenase
MDLKGKVVMVTGAAGGIGRATSLKLAASGASVLATDLDGSGAQETARLIVDANGSAWSMPHDVTDADAWAEAMRRLDAEAGRLDGLVNNAGYMLTRPFKQTTFEEFKRQQAVNVDSVWLGCQAAHDLLVRTASKVGSASIVNLSSTLGLKGGPMYSAYCTSKGAVRLLSKALAVELGRHNVRVNSVHPGLVDTALGMGAMRDLLKHGAPAESLEALLKGNALRTPLGRSALAEDVARVIAFLCSEASAFVSGAELIVDGGRSAS